MKPWLLTRVAAFVIVLAMACPAAFAVNPGEMLDDPALETRARTISSELRCLVCQNQSIDDSDAPLAHDLRILVRERLVAGDDDGQILEFIVARYGEFVLLRPRFAPHTMALWLAPVVLLMIGAIVVFRMMKARRPQKPRPLSVDEERQLATVLKSPD